MKIVTCEIGRSFNLINYIGVIRGCRFLIFDTVCCGIEIPDLGIGNHKTGSKQEPTRNHVIDAESRDHSKKHANNTKLYFAKKI